MPVVRELGSILESTQRAAEIKFFDEALQTHRSGSLVRITAAFSVPQRVMLVSGAFTFAVWDTSELVAERLAVRELGLPAGVLWNLQTDGPDITIDYLLVQEIEGA